MARETIWTPPAPGTSISGVSDVPGLESVLNTLQARADAAATKADAAQTAAAAAGTLVSDDGQSTRQIKLGNDGRPYMVGGGITERVLSSRVGTLATARTVTGGSPDRVAGTLYQASPTRPARVIVQVALSCPLGQSVSAVLYTGDDADHLVEEDREEMDFTGAVGIVGITTLTATLTMTTTRKTKLLGDLAPGQWYKVVLTKTGSATVSMTGLKERVY